MLFPIATSPAVRVSPLSMSNPLDAELGRSFSLSKSRMRSKDSSIIESFTIRVTAPAPSIPSSSFPSENWKL